MSITEVEVGRPGAHAPVAPRPAAPGRRAPGAAGVVLAAAAMLAAASLFCAASLFSSFRMYDDEGYLMMTVAHLMGGRALYDEVPTFYGPAYYAARLLLHEGAGIGLTSDNVRWITAGFWIASAAMGALVAWRLSRRPSAAALAFLGVVVHLAPAFRNEPGHPQDIAVLLTLMIVAAATWADARRAGIGVAALGGLVAWLALVKVNLGVYAGLALLLATASATRGRAARAATIVLSAAAAALPFVLMRGALGQPRWLCTAASMSLGILAVSLVAIGGHRPFARRPAAAAMAMLAGAVAAAVPPILVVLARGTSPHGLVEGIVLAPLRLGSTDMGDKGPVFPVGVAWAGIWAAAAAAIGLGRWPSPAARHAEAAATAIKGLFGLAVLLARLVPHHATIFVLYNFAVPLAWFVLARPRAVASPGAGPTLGRRALGFLSVLMALQTYPVAGSQRECGTVLLMPIAAACLADAIDRAGRLVGPGRLLRRGLAAIPRAAAALAFGMVAWGAVSAAGQYRTQSPAGDAFRGRGADRVRFLEQDAATLQWLAANLSRHADTFQCASGLNSLYSWTGLPSPTPIVVGNTLEVCTDAQQRAIVRALGAHPRAVAVDKPGYFDAGRGGRGAGGPAGPLRAAFREQYVSCGSVDGYDFRVRRGRPRPVLVDCVRRGDAGRPASAALTPAGAVEAHRAQVFDTDAGAILADTLPGPGVPPLRVVEADSGATLPPDPSSPGGDGIDLSAGRRLELALPESARAHRGGFLVLRLIGRDGDVLRSVPFLDQEPPDGEGG